MTALRPYLLLDAALHNDAPTWASLAGGVCVYTGPNAAEQAGAMPHLAPVGNEDTPLERFVRRELWPGTPDAPEAEAERRAWGIRLESGASPETLRAHAEAWLFVNSPADETWLFRFWDARLIPAFLEACTPEEAARWWGPVATVHLPRADGRYDRLDNPGEPGAAMAERFPLREAHVAAMERVRLELRVPAFEAFLRAEFAPETAALDDDALRAQVLAGLAAATAQGFYSERDAATWLALTALHGGDFHQQDWARAILDDSMGVRGTGRIERLREAGFARSEGMRA